MNQRVPTIDHRPTADDGFTLIEILIAIVLVGILSAVVVIGIGNLTDKGKSSACAYEQDSLRTAVNIYFATHAVIQIPQDLAAGVTPMDTLRLAGAVDANSKMYSVAPDGTLTPIPGNTNGCGAVPATIPPTTTPAPFLDPPGNFAATAGNATATFTWTAANSSGRGDIYSYVVAYTDPDHSFYQPQACIVFAPAPLTCTVDSGLKNGTTYLFDIIVYTTTGMGSARPPMLFVTPDAKNPVVKAELTAPRNLAAVVGDGTVTLTWDVPLGKGSDPITQYKIVDGDTYATMCTVKPTEPLTCTLTGLTNDVKYSFFAAVTNQAGLEVHSGFIRDVTPRAVP